MGNTKFKTFDLLERLATTEQKNKGLDIADVLINHDWKEYRKQTDHKPKPKTELKPSSNNNLKTNNHERIEDLKNRIETNRKQIAELNRVTENAKATFKEIAEHCRLEWIRPKWIARPNTNKIDEINYWLR